MNPNHPQRERESLRRVRFARTDDVARDAPEPQRARRTATAAESAILHDATDRFGDGAYEYGEVFLIDRERWSQVDDV